VPLISLIIILIVVGVLLWLINTYMPVNGKIKKILNVVVVSIVIAWLLCAFGVFDLHSNLHIGRFELKW